MVLPGTAWPSPTLLRYGLRSGVAAQVADLADLRTETVSPGELPDGGTVSVAGEVRPHGDGGVLRPAGSRTPAVVCRLRVDAYPEPIDDPAGRSFTDGSVALDDVHAVPFVLSGDGGRAVVDPVPRDPAEGLTPARTVRPRTDYLTTDLEFPDEGLVVAGRLATLGERRRSWLRSATDLADEAFVRVLERRVGPGDRVRVLGHRVRHDRGVDRDVINVQSLREPFRIAPVGG